MPDPEAPSPIPQRKRGDENVYRIILWGTVALLLVCLGAWLIYKYMNGQISPRPSPNPEPHSMLVIPGPPAPLTLA